MQDLIAFATQNGFSPPSIELDGKIHRFDRNGKKNAWYVGWQNHSIKTGQVYQVATFGDWKTGDEITYKPDIKLSREDNSAIKKALEQAQAKSKIEREIKQKEAAAEANKIFAKAAYDIQHPYRDKKRLDKNFGSKVLGDTLLIPMRNIKGELHGLQRIFPDGAKRFLTGQRTTGLFHSIGEMTDDIYICEGFATASTIHDATNSHTVCAFSAHNLIEVTKEFRKEFPAANITVCADNDRFTEGNPGREKGDTAASIAGAAIVIPEFPPDSLGTDFNDLADLCGLDEVRRQIHKIEVIEESGFIPLGFDEGVHFFYTFDGHHITKMSTFAETQMMQLMPLEYWEELYPKKGGVNWLEAKDKLIQMSQKIGPFDSTRIRGTGVWLDRKRTVVNTGDHLLIENHKIAHSQIKSDFVYVKTKNKMPMISKSKLSTAETKYFIAACHKLKWKSPKSGPLLAGWIAIARIAGSLPIRPHIWITGGAGTGKSTVMDQLVRPALGHASSRLYLQGGSTEAGIRQSVKADSLPILFDEFESTGPGSQERVANLIDLLRQSWSHTQGCVVKGSASGYATQYSLAFAALVSSIRVSLNNDADRSRFTILELDRHGADNQKNFDEFLNLLKHINEEYGERLFARSIDQAHNIIKSFSVFRGVLAGEISQRFGQQYGMLLAGFYSLVSDGPVSHETATELVKGIDWDDEKGDAAEKDEHDCWAHLLSTKVQIKEEISPYACFDWAIGEILKRSSAYLNQLKHYGILVKDDFIYIASNGSELQKIFRGTRWAKGWSKSLGRLPGSHVNKNQWISGRTVRCTGIPVSFISEPPQK